MELRVCEGGGGGGGGGSGVVFYDRENDLNFFRNTSFLIRALKEIISKDDMVCLQKRKFLKTI